MTNGRLVRVIDMTNMINSCKADQISVIPVSAEPAGHQQHCWCCAKDLPALETDRKRCITCKHAVYCCTKCHYGDWNLHKTVCRPPHVPEPEPDDVPPLVEDDE
jgi:hypothetical protein